MKSDFERLLEILQQVVPNVDPSRITENSSLTADLGLNSLTIMLLAMSIEDKFDFEFDESAAFESVSDVLKYIAAHKTI